MGLLDWLTSAERTQQMQGFGNNLKGAIEQLKQQRGLLDTASRDTITSMKRGGSIFPDTPAQRQLDQSIASGVVNSIGPLMTKGVGKFVYPQEQALLIAQKNAALPIEKGGLGLPANNTPIDRAMAMGFEDGHFHGTRADTSTLKAVRPNYGVQAIEQATGLRPVFTTDSIGQASEYALRKNGGKNASVYPLMVRRNGEVGYDFNNQEWIKNREYLDPETTNGTLDGSQWLDTMPLYHWAKRENAPTVRMEGVHDGAGISHSFPSTVTAVINPSSLRSRFAAFDPARINENDLLGSATPEFLGLLAGGTTAGLGFYNFARDR